MLSPPGSALVVCVCTGNICRSPCAERLLVARLGAALAGARVASAGTAALLDHPVHPAMDVELTRRGGSSAGFRARALDAAELRSAGLILAATRAHRGAVAALEPAAVPRLFTLREFARYAAALQERGWQPPADAGPGVAPVLAAAVTAALELRGVVRVTAADDDIADPIGGPPAAYALAADQIATAVDGIVGLVTAARHDARR